MKNFLCEFELLILSLHIHRSRMKTLLLLLSLVCAGPAPIDSVKTPASAQSNRNVMLNAEDSSKPRDINIGLSTGDIGTVVLEDGLLMNFVDYPVYQYHHWAGGNAYSSQDLKALGESLLSTGQLMMMIDSHTRLGGERFGGAVTAASSSFGRIKFDSWFGGPIGAGFYFSLGAFVNLDPGSTHPAQKLFTGERQIFKAALTKRWRSGEASVLYKLTLSNDVPSGALIAPFYYVGDGSIRPYENFQLGRDNYFPVDDAVTLKDAYDGTRYKGNMLRDMNNKVLHDITLTARQDAGDGWKLKAGIHAFFTDNFNYMSVVNSGISLISGGMNASGRRVTLPDGTPFEGQMQTRQINNATDRYLDIIGSLGAEKDFGRHQLKLGIDDVMDKQFLYSSTAQFAHTVSPNPERLYLDGQDSWNYNLSSLYVDGWSNHLCAFALEEWDISRRLGLHAGLRGGVQYFNTLCAVNPEGQTYNSRRDGFYVKDGICRPQNIEKTDWSLSSVVSLNWNISGKLYATAEHFFAANPRIMVIYFGSDMPNGRHTFVQLARAALNWSCKWMDIAAIFSYTRKDNNASSVNASKLVNGMDETISYLSLYSYGTPGLTADANLRWKGLNLHLLGTWQEPKYLNYACDLTFSDGITQHIDYSGNYVTGMSRFLVEIDPSYTWKNLKVWGSVRYFSKQYANRVNNVCFNGHWETFAGVNYNFNEHVGLSCDFVNLLGSSGAKGEIDAADTITDSSLLNNYLISGTYLIPFTVNFSVSCRF